jgi:hypothetical protein
MTIRGLAGPVVLEAGLFSFRYTITVGGQPATRVGGRRYALPAAGGGTVEAAVRGSFLDPYPTLEVNGVKHRTGPSVPIALRALALVPILLVGIGGGLGAVIGILGIAGNMAIARTRMSSLVKALLMVWVLVVAFAVWYVVASVVLGALRNS